MANPNPNPITRFKPGDEWRGNPGGRPKGRSLASILREVLNEDNIDGKPFEDGRRVADAVVRAMVGHAIGGDASMMKQLWDRHDGTAPEAIDDTTTDADVTGDMADAMIRAGLKAKGVSGGPDS